MVSPVVLPPLQSPQFFSGSTSTSAFSHSTASNYFLPPSQLNFDAQSLQSDTSHTRTTADLLYSFWDHVNEEEIMNRLAAFLEN